MNKYLEIIIIVAILAVILAIVEVASLRIYFEPD